MGEKISTRFRGGRNFFYEFYGGAIFFFILQLEANNYELGVGT